MAFSETLRKLATVVGLYGKESDAEYGYGGGYGDGYDSGYESGYDDGAYDDGGYDGYGDAYGGDYAQSDSAYGSAYQAPPQDDDPSYQSGYGATGSYARAGARPKAAAPSPRRQSAASRGARAQQRPNNVLPLREREERYGAPEGRSAAKEPGIARAARSVSRQTTVFCARRKEDSEQIITYLVEGITVVLNLEELDDVQYRRVLDMVSGAAFALSASVIRTSQRGYLIAPEGTVIVDEQRDSDPRDSREPRDGYSSRW